MKRYFGATPFAKGEYPGLQALEGGHRSYIGVARSESRNIRASVNVDATMHESNPDDPRWDYIVWFEGKEVLLPCVEIHPANSSHVDDVIEKKKWLERIIAGILLPPRKYYWVPTGDVAFSALSSKMRRLHEAGIKITRRVDLSPI